MITMWIDARLARATWLGLGVWVIVWTLYASWAFGMGSAWAQSLVASGGTLPETLFGFERGQPETALSQLGPVRGDYLAWQGLDVLFAAINVMITSIGIALGLHATTLARTAARLLLLLPVIYFGAELLENLQLSAFTLALFDPASLMGPVQQLTTSLKHLAGNAALALAGLGILVAAGRGLGGLVRFGDGS